MNASRLEHNGELQSETVTRGSGGSFANTWTTFRRPYVRISPKGGGESFFSDAVRAQMTHSIRMRAGATRVTPHMRLLWNSRVYNFIEAQDVDEKGIEIIIAAIENLDVTETGTPVSSTDFEYNTGALDFLATAVANSVTFSPVTDKRLYLDSVEVVCISKTGVISAQPSLTVGITGSLTKFLTVAATMNLTAANLRDVFNMTLIDSGETELIVRCGDASGPSVYTGCVILRGRLVG